MSWYRYVLFCPGLSLLFLPMEWLRMLTWGRRPARHVLVLGQECGPDGQPGDPFCQILDRVCDLWNEREADGDRKIFLLGGYYHGYGFTYSGMGKAYLRRSIPESAIVTPCENTQLKYATTTHGELRTLFYLCGDAVVVCTHLQRFRARMIALAYGFNPEIVTAPRKVPDRIYEFVATFITALDPLGLVLLPLFNRLKQTGAMQRKLERP